LRQNVETRTKEPVGGEDLGTPLVSEKAVSSLASPLIGNTNVTNDRVIKFNHKMLNEELNRDVLQLDRSSPVKLLEESSGGPSS